MSDNFNGGVVGHEVSLLRKDQTMMEQELDSSKKQFAEYIKGLGDQMREQLSVPAELLKPDTVVVTGKKEKRNGLFKRFLDWITK